MKRIWTIIVISSFVAVLFGSLYTTAHGDSHGFICLAVKINGSEAPCPEADPFGFASFHSNALKKISSLIIVDSAALLYIIALHIFLICGAVSFLDFNKLSLRRIKFSEFELLTASGSLPAAKLFWFSLHENSPSYI